AMLPPLVVRRRTEPPPRLALGLDPVEGAVEREVEVEPGLLAVGDRVEARGHLVAHGAGDGVLDELRDVVRTEVAEVLARVLEPAGERIAADHRRPERPLVHADILAPWPSFASTTSHTSRSRRRSTT